jgi:uncharacterized protein involved in response to NO
MTPISITEPARRGGPKNGFSLWALGFRPFYLLAAAFAVLAMLVWVLVLSGQLAVPMAGVWWHAHEMLFGFVSPVIVGFLFTAGRNWTGLETPTGRPLAGLAVVWLIGRLGMAIDGGMVTALVDSAFLPLAAAAIARVLWRAGSRRNYFLVGILGLLAAANITFHLARFAILILDPLVALHFALGIIVVLETTIGGRVIPAFTATALKGVWQWQSRSWNVATIAVTGMALLGWAVLPDACWPAALSLFAVGLQVRRCMGWNPWATRHVPLLWVLHLAHLWIPVGLALLATTQLGWLPRSAGVHALTIGATGGLIIGMITRTALGHTGRALKVGRLEVMAYASVQLAAVVRVLTVAAIPVASTGGIHLAATLWMLAFLLYLWRYGPWLVRPRIDGQPG